jgi:hypothetical protein
LSTQTSGGAPWLGQPSKYNSSIFTTNSVAPSRPRPTPAHRRAPRRTDGHRDNLRAGRDFQVVDSGAQHDRCGLRQLATIADSVGFALAGFADAQLALALLRTLPSASP